MEKTILSLTLLFFDNTDILNINWTKGRKFQKKFEVANLQSERILAIFWCFSKKNISE